MPKQMEKATERFAAVWKAEDVGEVSQAFIVLLA